MLSETFWCAAAAIKETHENLWTVRGGRGGTGAERLVPLVPALPTRACVCACVLHQNPPHITFGTESPSIK